MTDDQNPYNPLDTKSNVGITVQRAVAETELRHAKRARSRAYRWPGDPVQPQGFGPFNRGPPGYKPRQRVHRSRWMMQGV